MSVSGSKTPGFICSHFPESSEQWPLDNIGMANFFEPNFPFSRTCSYKFSGTRSKKSTTYNKVMEKKDGKCGSICASTFSKAFSYSSSSCVQDMMPVMEKMPIMDVPFGPVSVPMTLHSGTPPKRKQTASQQQASAKRSSGVSKQAEKADTTTAAATTTTTTTNHSDEDCTKQDDCDCSACQQRRKLVAELLAEEESSKKKKQKKKKKKDKNGVKSTNTNNVDGGDDEKNKEKLRNIQEQFDEIEQEMKTITIEDEQQEMKNYQNIPDLDVNKKSSSSNNNKKPLRVDNKSASQTSDETTDLNTSELQHWIEMKNKYTIPNSPSWSLDEAGTFSEEEGNKQSEEWDDEDDIDSDSQDDLVDGIQDMTLHSSNDSSTMTQAENIELKARLLAIDAQESFMHREVKGALELITEAIELEPKEPVYYINRSFYYQQSCEFLLALRDTESALGADENELYLEHSLYSKANALIGLERFDQAETVLNRIRSLPNNASKFIPRLEKDLMLVRLKKLVSNDYTLPVARLYAFKYGSIKEALAALESNCVLLTKRSCNLFNLKLHLALINSLEEEIAALDEEVLSGIYEEQANQFVGMHDDYDDEEIYFSDEEERDIFYANSDKWNRSKDILNKTIPEFEEAREPPDPRGQKALWIGNVSPNCSISLVTHLFMKYGNVTFCKIFTNEKISDTSYLLLHYDNDLSARLVMNYYKDKVIPGISKDDSPLLIRFRNKNDKLEESYESPVLGASNTLNSPSSGTIPSSPGPTTTSNTKSVYATECYYWRTTGCDRERCNFKHVSAHKGIDKQAWMRKKT